MTIFQINDTSDINLVKTAKQVPRTTHVIKVVESLFDEHFARNFGRFSPALNDDLRVNFLTDEFLCLTEKFSSQNCDSGRSISNFFVLSSRNVDQNLCRWIVYVYGLEYGRPVICDSDLFAGVFISKRL